MMKPSMFLLSCALACGSVWAQSPASPASPADPASPTSPAAKEAMPPAGAGMQPGGATGKGSSSMGGMSGMSGMGGAHGAMGMDMKAMDKNSDGMISKKEFNSHHEAMWKKMKSKNGMVSVADMEAMMMQGGRN